MNRNPNAGIITRFRNLVTSYFAYHIYARYQNTQGMYRNLLQLNPIYRNKQKYYYKLSSLAQKQSKWKDALKYMNQAISHTETSNDANVLVSKAKILTHLGKLDEAISCLEKHLSFYPQDSDTLLSLATTYEKNKQRNLAIPILQQYIKEHPKDFNVYFQLAHNFRLMGEYSQAESHYHHAVQNIDQVSNKKVIQPTIYWLGCMQLRNNKEDLAASTFKRLIKVDASLNSENLGVGIFHEHHKQWDLAIKAYTHLLLENPLQAELNFRLATILDKKMYLPTEAIHYYEKALEVDKVRSPWHFALANCYEQLGQYEQAVISFTRAINRQEKHRPGNYRRLGQVLTKLGKKDEALDAFHEAELFSKPNYMDHSFYKRNISKEKVRYAMSYEYYPINDHMIFYESLSGTRMMDSPFAIFEHVFKKEDFKHFTHIWVVNSFHVIPEEYRGMENIIFVKKRSDAYFKYISSAKYLICNSTFDPYVVRKPEQKYLQTSHGIFYKTVGRDSSGSPIGVAGSTRNLLQATHIIVPNEYMAEKQPKSYSIQGIHSGDIAKIGYPRIDVTVNMTSKEKQEISAQLGLDHTQKNVLYVPTWRGETKATNRFDGSQLMNDLRALGKLDVNVIFRGHPISNRLLKNINIPNNVTIPPPDILTNELLGLSDIVISDYSSVFFDFLVTERPIIHYLYDLETYKKEHGLNLKEEELPGTIAKTTNELIEAVENHLVDNKPNEHYLNGKQRFCPYDDGQSTERVVTWFFYGNTTHINFVEAPTSPTTLYVVGDMPKPSSFVKVTNDVTKLAANGEIVTFLFSNDIRKNKEKEKLVTTINDQNINFIVHDKNMPVTIDEAFAIHYINKHSSYLNDKMEGLSMRAFKREGRRLFGDTHFHTVININTKKPYYNNLQNLLSDSKHR